MMRAYEKDHHAGKVQEGESPHVGRYKGKATPGRLPSRVQSSKDEI